MRIFQVIEASTNVSLPGNNVWYRNLHTTLLTMGLDVFLVPAEQGRRAQQTGSRTQRRLFSERVVREFDVQHARSPFDIAFFYLMDGMFEPWIVEHISAKVTTCNFSCNNMHQFYLVERIARLFHLNLCAEKGAVAKFRDIGAQVLWWPMAANPDYFAPRPLGHDIDVSFVGGTYGVRIESIAQLLRAGIAVHAFGPGWAVSGWRRTRAFRLLRGIKRSGAEFARLLAVPRRNPCIGLARQANSSYRCAAADLLALLNAEYPDRFHGAIDDDALVALYSRSRVSLGLLDVYEHHDYTKRRLRHLHLRDFEAPMSGACYCTDYSDELAEMFEPDVEVITCRDIYERTDKVRHYAGNGSDAERVRSAGRRRALAHHTYRHRFESLFRHLGLDPSGKA